MKRWFVVAALAIALVLPAQAAAKTAPYSGTVTPSGTVSFNVVTIVVKKKGKKKKRRFVTNFRWNAVPVTCASGPARTTSGSVGFVVKLSGSFRINAQNSAGATVGITGTPTAGTITLSGDLPLDQGGSGQAPCNSGVLNWTAARA